MLPDTASHPPTAVVLSVSPGDTASADRWRQWQMRNAVTSRMDEKRAQVAFTVIFALLGAWLGRLLLAPSF